MQKPASMFKALGDETRLRIMGLLVLHGELCVCDFEGLLSISQSKSSRHLRYLYNAGLVQNRREGKWMYYRVPDAPDAHGRTLLRAVEELLSDELRDDLSQRLATWFERKDAETAGSCSTQPA
jgi:ArsR family transcriptional regulator